MCTKYEPYFHQKSANWALNLMFFLLMLLNKFVPNSTFRRCISGTNFFKYNANLSQISPENKKIVQISFWFQLIKSFENFHIVKLQRAKIALKSCIRRALII